jgi:hypothetical protein
VDADGVLAEGGRVTVRPFPLSPAFADTVHVSTDGWASLVVPTTPAYDTRAHRTAPFRRSSQQPCEQAKHRPVASLQVRYSPRTLLLTIIAVLLAPSVLPAQTMPFEPNGPTLAAWPNCAAPGDTIWFKTQGWPLLGPNLFYSFWVPDDEGDSYIFGTKILDGNDVGTAIRDFDFVLEPYGSLWNPPYDGEVAVTQDVCETHDFYGTCTQLYCRKVPFHVRAANELGNAHSTSEAIPNAYGPSVTQAESLDHQFAPAETVLSVIVPARIWIRFRPDLQCNTSPCAKIRAIQTVHPLVNRGSGYHFEPLHNFMRGPHFAQMDSLMVNEWVIDYPPAEHEPYANGDEPPALILRKLGYTAVGTMGGASPLEAFLMDSPVTTDNVDIDILGWRLEYEDNFFCSSGANAGEWIGSVSWVWRRDAFDVAFITGIETFPRQKPTTQFMGALTRFCDRFNFELPGIMLPTEGGSACSEAFLLRAGRGDR